ncbi:LamB/YcsF family protein [Brevibacillus sp. M2.1A]|uniref:LamB/YcsF family protein n=1 Tax=Brevibacillus TaxID=55080 RepID=UPI00156AD351|nr:MULTISPECIES: 5-oxoprolinase subunit PxpA [Brevibacillus]MBY0084238.1 LamB/YcsF family protein [Brevibacillus brevis]MCC8436218.1 LamB/YcsF family protein [Brevibacillus sp. M2.1A]
MKSVDLNCDMGESFGAYRIGNDEAILRYVSSANVACGFHAGDPGTMRKTVQMALEAGVAIGAHPGFADLVGFGRRNMEISPEEAYDLVVYQIGALQGFVRAEGGVMHHVKPHGALYNMAATRPALAESIALAIYKVNPELVLYGLAGSELTRAGEKIGLATAHEVFADRTYQQDGTLTPRNQPNAMITDQQQSLQQVIRMVRDGLVLTQQGVDIPIQADTICIHGDGAHALEFAQSIREALLVAGIPIVARVAR